MAICAFLRSLLWNFMPSRKSSSITSREAISSCISLPALFNSVSSNYTERNTRFIYKCHHSCRLRCQVTYECTSSEVGRTLCSTFQNRSDQKMPLTIVSHIQTNMADISDGIHQWLRYLGVRGPIKPSVKTL